MLAAPGDGHDCAAWDIRVHRACARVPSRRQSSAPSHHFGAHKYLPNAICLHIDRLGSGGQRILSPLSFSKMPQAGYDNLVNLHRCIARGGTQLEIRRAISTFLRTFKHGESFTISDAVYLPDDPVSGGVDTKGWSALHRAVHYGRDDIARILLRCGASPNKLDARGKTPRQLVPSRSESMKAVFKEHDAMLTCDQRDRKTAIMKGTSAALISHVARFDGSDGSTYHEWYTKMHQLLKRGADPFCQSTPPRMRDWPGKGMTTALHTAIVKGQPMLLAMMIHVAKDDPVFNREELRAWISECNLKSPSRLPDAVLGVVDAEGQSLIKLAAEQTYKATLCKQDVDGLRTIIAYLLAGGANASDLNGMNLANFLLDEICSDGCGSQLVATFAQLVDAGYKDYSSLTRDKTLIGDGDLMNHALAVVLMTYETDIAYKIKVAQTLVSHGADPEVLRSYLITGIKRDRFTVTRILMSEIYSEARDQEVKLPLFEGLSFAEERIRAFPLFYQNGIMSQNDWLKCTKLASGPSHFDGCILSETDPHVQRLRALTTPKVPWWTTGMHWIYPPNVQASFRACLLVNARLSTRTVSQATKIVCDDDDFGDDVIRASSAPFAARPRSSAEPICSLPNELWYLIFSWSPLPWRESTRALVKDQFEQINAPILVNP